jgi:uncharacterized protein with beta-barrel porin domain
MALGAPNMAGQVRQRVLCHARSAFRAASIAAERSRRGAQSKSGLPTYFHHFLPSQTLTFAGTRQSFTDLCVPLTSDSATILAGPDIGLSRVTILSIGCDGEISSHIQNNAIRAQLSWKF